MSIRGVVSLIVAAGLVAGVGYAQDEKVDESFQARTVAMGVGAAGVVQIHVTRWTTEEEREALANTLVQKGQEEFVKELGKQQETGWVRTQTGRGMRGQPSVRMYYAFQFPKPDGSRTLVLVTNRTLGFLEVMRAGRSTEYDISAVVLEMKTGDDGKETGVGTLYDGAKIGYDADKKQITVESFEAQPVRLTEVTRQK
ncbi:MAG: hypothetical protein PVJ49_09180 [Acidobacteriota bacterium]|jgi:hypothetical protein